MIRDEQFICLKLFKAIVFEGSEDPAKQIVLEDILRFFRLNRLLIESDRVQSVFLGRIIGHENPLDF